jgi:hypothetical protein
MVIKVVFEPGKARVYTYRYLGETPVKNQLVVVEIPDRFGFNLAKVVQVGGEELVPEGIILKNAYYDLTTMRKEKQK